MSEWHNSPRSRDHAPTEAGRETPVSLRMRSVANRAESSATGSPAPGTLADLHYNTDSCRGIRRSQGQDKPRRRR